MSRIETTYQSPELEVIGIRAESIICVSGEDVENTAETDPLFLLPSVI